MATRKTADKAGKAGQIRIGIGGWTFEPWRGTFYPEGVVGVAGVGHLGGDPRPRTEVLFGAVAAHQRHVSGLPGAVKRRGISLSAQPAPKGELCRW